MSETEVTIRPIADADAGELLTLRRAAFVTEAQQYDDPHIPPLTQTLDELAASGYDTAGRDDLADLEGPTTTAHRGDDEPATARDTDADADREADALEPVAAGTVGRRARPAPRVPTARRRVTGVSLLRRPCHIDHDGYDPG